MRNAVSLRLLVLASIGVSLIAQAPRARAQEERLGTLTLSHPADAPVSGGISPSEPGPFDALRFVSTGAAQLVGVRFTYLDDTTETWELATPLAIGASSEWIAVPDALRRAVRRITITLRFASAGRHTIVVYGRARPMQPPPLR